MLTRKGAAKKKAGGVNSHDLDGIAIRVGREFVGQSDGFIMHKAMIQRKNKSYVCVHCSIRCPSIPDLRNHLRAEHPQP